MKTTTALLVLVLMAAGCAKAPENKVASVSGDGKSSSSAPSNTKKDGEFDEQKMLEFAKCMREHGVDMPDPETEEGGVAIRIDGNVDEETMKKADEACRKHLPNGGEMRKPSPEELDKMRQQAKCMRDKGYDFPDPDADGGKGMALPMDDSEKTQKDMKDCGFEGAVRIGG
jgi:hypothetical protein